LLYGQSSTATTGSSATTAAAATSNYQNLYRLATLVYNKLL
jgi:hypothetical protein